MNKIKKDRIEKIKKILPIKYFYEPSFDTNERIKILQEQDFYKEVLDNDSLFRESIILSREQEYKLFRKLNYFKYRIFKLTNNKNLNFLRESGISEIEQIINKICKIKEVIIKCNTRLMIKPISKKVDKDSFNRDELICNSCFYIIKAIDLFDYRLGYKFSTYYVNALHNNLLKDVVKQDSFGSGLLLQQPDKKQKDYKEVNDVYNKKFIESMIKELDKKFGKKSRSIIIKKSFGVCGHKKETLEQIGNRLNLSKERIRQVINEYIEVLKNTNLVYDPLV